MDSRTKVESLLKDGLARAGLVRPGRTTESRNALAVTKEDIRRALALVEAEPGPAPPPSTVSPDLFNGAKLTDFKVEGVAAHIKEVNDPLGARGQVICLDTYDDDFLITPNPRSQLLTPNFIKEGLEYWLAFEFMFADDFPQIPGWLTIATPAYGAPYNGPSPFRLEVAGERLQVLHNPTYGESPIWAGEALRRGHWYSVLLHTQFSGAGYVWMELDGRLVVPRLNMETRDASNNSFANYAKICHYRKRGMFEHGRLYFSGLRIGTSRASVTPV
jgi:hypothetical protein